MNIQATLSLASRNYIHFYGRTALLTAKRGRGQGIAQIIQQMSRNGSHWVSVKVVLFVFVYPIFPSLACVLSQLANNPSILPIRIFMLLSCITKIYYYNRYLSKSSQSSSNQEFPQQDCLLSKSLHLPILASHIPHPKYPQLRLYSRQQHNFPIQKLCLIQKLQRQLMKQLNVAVLVLVLTLIPSTLANFDLSIVGTNGSIYQTFCNTQTTLEFQFSSSSTVGPSQAVSGLSSSSLKFLDVNGNDLVLPLTNFALDSNTNAINFVKGYGFKFSATNTTYAASLVGAYLFKFSDGTNNVYVYIPVTNSGSIYNPDVVDLTAAGGAVAGFVIPSSGTGAAVPLTPFNMVNENTYNQWYTSNVGTSSILVSNFVYKVPGTNVAAATTTEAAWQTTMLTGTNWNTALATNSAKLCYASTITTGNFQTHLRESVPLWFAWFWTFFYWLFFLISDSINVKVFDKHFENNKWTCCSLYSLFHLAHDEFFSRLSRTTVILLNWTIQGVFIASIYGNNLLGAPMIIWTAVIAFVATLPFPFIFGYAFLKKMYEKCLIKYENMKGMKGVFDKSRLQPLQQEIDTCEEKLYGYYHWYYSLTFVVYFVCWPIAVNQMQKLGRVDYYYHWYWLASMGIVFALEHFIYEPLLALLFGDREIVRNRGGFFYNFQLGTDYRAAQTF